MGHSWCLIVLTFLYALITLRNAGGARNKTNVVLKRKKRFRTSTFTATRPDIGYEYHLAVYMSIMGSATLMVNNRIQKDLHVPYRVSYDWFYDAQQDTLIHCASNLSLTVNASDWTLYLEECGNTNQAFIYDESSNELFWKNPETKKLHVIYIKLAQNSHIRQKYSCYVAVNSMDMIESFDEITSIKQRHRIWRAATAFSLSKCNKTRDLSSEILQNWLRIIESFSFNNVTFGLFNIAKGGYLFGDGYFIASEDTQSFDKSDYKYYGLWKIDTERGRLIHYLSDYKLHLTYFLSETEKKNYFNLSKWWRNDDHDYGGSYRIRL